MKRVVRILTLSLALASGSAFAGSGTSSTEVGSCNHSLLNFSSEGLGYYRVAPISPQVAVGNPMKNAESIVRLSKQAAENHSIVALFPELTLTGYTLEDGFFSERILRSVRESLAHVMQQTKDLPTAVVVGAPYPVKGRLFNVAFVIHRGKIVGAVPKTYLPNYAEFREKRWFDTGKNVDEAIDDDLLGNFQLKTDQIFRMGEMTFAIEICEDGWDKNPPSNRHVDAGAQVILNLSASNELVNKADYRTDMFGMMSSKQHVAYVYTSAQAMESSKDIVFGGHRFVFQDGKKLFDNRKQVLTSFEDGIDFVDVDVELVTRERFRDKTFSDQPIPKNYTTVKLEKDVRLPQVDLSVGRYPFVGPRDGFAGRADEILKIQAMGLASHLKATNQKNMILGLSGGKDSTWALVVCIEAAKLLKWSPERVIAITMPGFGQVTKGSFKKDSAQALQWVAEYFGKDNEAAVKTILGEDLESDAIPMSTSYQNALSLAQAFGVTLKEVDIKLDSYLQLRMLGHDGQTQDIAFENAQARERTRILFDFANVVKSGLVVGTGDLSEIWLGWCTFNGDQMAHYNVNASIPKTLIMPLIDWYAADPERSSEAEKEALLNVARAGISPELYRAGVNGSPNQETEASVGPYALSDFFMYYYVRHGFSPRKIFELAKIAFGTSRVDGELTYTPATIQKWLIVFFERGFRSQFKRDTFPLGPKVGTISFSPRGDFRYPTAADFGWMIDEIRKFSTE